MVRSVVTLAVAWPSPMPDRALPWSRDSKLGGAPRACVASTSPEPVKSTDCSPCPLAYGTWQQSAAADGSSDAHSATQAALAASARAPASEGRSPAPTRARARTFPCGACTPSPEERDTPRGRRVRRAGDSFRLLVASVAASARAIMAGSSWMAIVKRLSPRLSRPLPGGGLTR